MLDVRGLLELEEVLREVLCERFEEILIRINASGQLEDFLSMMGLQDLIGGEAERVRSKNGKILIIGQAEVEENRLAAIAQQYGIEKDRLEFCLNYDDAKTFDFRKTQWSPTYSLILAGPMPHSGVSKGDYESVLSALEHEEGYPPVVRMGANGLKITKSSFRASLDSMTKSGLIA